MYRHRPRFRSGSSFCFPAFDRNIGLSVVRRVIVEVQAFIERTESGARDQQRLPRLDLFTFERLSISAVGRVAEWFKAPVLKTGRGRELPREFESHPFRQITLRLLKK